MSDDPSSFTAPLVLESELARLKAHIARLEARIAELDRLAHEDPLVPLLNRRGFVRQLEKAIARFERYAESAALLYVDVDGLKMVNDSFGHAAGDAALLHVADLLSSSVRLSDCVARLGGDEFGVLLERCDEGLASDTAARLCDRIAAHDFLHEGHPVPLSVSIGIATVERGDTPTSLLARGDNAMYAVKDAA